MRSKYNWFYIWNAAVCGRFEEIPYPIMQKYEKSLFALRRAYLRGEVKKIRQRDAYRGR